jgi:hypothetical protein
VEGVNIHPFERIQAIFGKWVMGRLDCDKEMDEWLGLNDVLRMNGYDTVLAFGG